MVKYFYQDERDSKWYECQEQDVSRLDNLGYRIKKVVYKEPKKSENDNWWQEAIQN